MNLTTNTAAIWLAVGVLIFSASVAVAADPFPAEALPGMEIGSDLPSGYEPSGAVWHTGLNKLLVVSDGGLVSALNSDGTSVTNWSVTGDLEAISVVDPSSPFVYLGLENPDSILELNINTGVVTRSFDLTPWMTGPPNEGLEALTFLPDQDDSEGGRFYAGLQSDGSIYSFRLSIATSSSATTVTHLQTITPVPGRTDISGLHYDRDNEVLYAIFDSSNQLRAMKADGSLLAEWSLVGNDQEGIALVDDTLFIAEDVGNEVWRYAPFPSILHSSAGDFDGDDDVDPDDVDLLAVHVGSTDPIDLFLYDVNEDGVIDFHANGTGTNSDSDYLIRAILGTEYGDANLDGEVGLSDLDLLGQGFARRGTGWLFGDFNGTGETSLVDLDLLGQFYGFVAAGGAAAANFAAPIPEPSTCWLVVIGIAMSVVAARRRLSC